MIYQKYIARCYRVYQHERNENASFLSIFNGGGRPKWRFSNFPRFWKNSSALGSFNCIFENNSLNALFGQNMKKLKILKLSPNSRYVQKLALKPLQNGKVMSNNKKMLFSYFHWNTNEKKGNEKTTLFHDRICHDCDIAWCFWKNASWDTIHSSSGRHSYCFIQPCVYGPLGNWV